MKWLTNKLKSVTAKQIVKAFRWIAGYARQYKWQILWYVFVGILSTALGLISGVLGKNLIDTITKVRTGKIAFIVIAYVFMQLFGIGFSALTKYISTRVQLKVGQQIRRDVFDKILNADWGYINEYHTGDLLARCSNDAGAVAGAVMGWVPTLVVNGVQFLGAFFLIMYYDYTLALVALISSPAVLLASYFLSRRVRRHSQKLHAVGAEITSFHTETFHLIHLVKSFGLVKARMEGLKKLQKKQKDITLEHNKYSLMTSSFMALVGMVVSGLCFLWSAYRLWEGEITFGEMTMFLQMTGTLSTAFGALASMVPSTITTATAAERIIEIMELPHEEYPNDKEVQDLLNNENCAITVSVENLNFSYDENKTVFCDARLSAEPGQIVAFIGSSGGGKTTMLRILLGLVKPKDGSITVSGGNPEITLPVSASTRRLFAYVPQENTLFSGTIAENLRVMRADASEEELWGALKLACADEFVRAMPDGVNAVLGEGGSGLSEGQIQRLSIARALLSRAPVLLLDEATSALDVKTERKLLSNILSLKTNRTFIIATHRPSVLELCHKVYRIGDEAVSMVDSEDVRRLRMFF